MIILHAGIYHNKFFLWAEKKTDEEFKPCESKAKKVKKVKAAPQPLPFAAGAEYILGSMAHADFDVKELRKESFITGGYLHTLTVNGFPVPSSSMVCEIPDLEGSPEIHPWKIEALEFTRKLTVDFLMECQNRTLLARGVVLGEDITFLSRVMRFAGSLEVRQRFLPGIQRFEDAYRARWEPIFTGKDADRLQALILEFPDSLRAFSPDPETYDSSTPSSILSCLICEIVDHIVRASETGGKSRGSARTVFESLHDNWLYALRSHYDGIYGKASDIELVMEQIREWQRPVFVSTRAPFRLCFRIEEPEEFSKNDTWRVNYLLQSCEDPSLLIPLEQAWNPDDKTEKLLSGDGFNVREYLFTSLGQASGICPNIMKSLRTSFPDGYDLTTTDALNFLADTAANLGNAGFGIILPAWWSGKGTKNKLSVNARAKQTKQVESGGFLTMDDIIELRWQVALAGEDLTFEELQHLASLKVPLVRLRGNWVQLDPTEIAEALKFWKEKASKKYSLRDVMKLTLGITDAPGGMEFTGIEAEGNLNDFISGLKNNTSFEEMTEPENFNGQLRPYQRRGLSWLKFLQQYGLGACLADDMGLGKTVQILASLLKDKKAGSNKPVLIVCPTSVTGNWQKEASKFTPELSTVVHHGATRKKGWHFTEEAKDQDLVITSYSLLHRDFRHFDKVDWKGIILDEAQNIKNPDTKQAKTARSLSAEYKVALTGTPVENNVRDLWSIMEFLNPGFLGNYNSFKSDFYIPIQFQQDQEAIEKLRTITEPFILRRLKTDKNIISDLPDKMEMKVYCTLTREQASLYTAVAKEVEEALKDAEGIERRGLILATIMKMKQICNHPRQFLGDNSSIPDRSGKLARVTEMLEEVIQVNERALIFTQFSEMGQILKNYLEETFGREVFFLYGATPRKQRELMVERFQNDPHGPNIFILSIKAGGTGLNLTRANHVFHFDRWWNPAVENQATDRAFRIGQKKNVEVHKFVTLGTMEEKIDEIIERKKEISEQVVGTGEGWLTELSTDELRDIFRLREEAIGD